jgi:hypothetical protein
MLTALCECSKPRHLVGVLRKIDALDLVGFVHFALTMARKAELHAVEVLPAVIRENGRKVLACLEEFTDALLRCIDPHEQRLRRNCVAAVTLAFNAVIAVCPMTSFSKASQKFAIGDLSGAVHVFDLRTASRIRHFTGGHKDAVSAVAFDKDGGRIASYCAADSKVCVWSCAPQSFFGGLLGQVSPLTVVRELSGGLKKFPTHPVALSIPLDAARMRWAETGEIWLHREDGSDQRIVI